MGKFHSNGDDRRKFRSEMTKCTHVHAHLHVTISQRFDPLSMILVCFYAGLLTVVVFYHGLANDATASSMILVCFYAGLLTVVVLYHGLANDATASVRICPSFSRGGPYRDAAQRERASGRTGLLAADCAPNHLLSPGTEGCIHVITDALQSGTAHASRTSWTCCVRTTGRAK